MKPQHYYAIAAAPAMFLLVLSGRKTLRSFVAHGIEWKPLVLACLNLLSLAVAAWGYASSDGREAYGALQDILIAYVVAALWIVPFYWFIDTYLPPKRGRLTRCGERGAAWEARLPRIRRVLRFIFRCLAILWLVQVILVWYCLSL